MSAQGGLKAGCSLSYQTSLCQRKLGASVSVMGRLKIFFCRLIIPMSAEQLWFIDVKVMHKSRGFPLCCMSTIQPALLMSGIRCHLDSVNLHRCLTSLWSAVSLRHVHVNSHHLNLSAPPIHSNMCQKLRWERGCTWMSSVWWDVWVVEYITKCQHIFSRIRPCQLRGGKRVLQREKSKSLKEWEHLRLCLWVCGDFGLLAKP